MGGQCLLVLIGLKVLVMMTSLQNIVISGAQGLLMLMESKFLIKMTINIIMLRLIVCKYLLTSFVALMFAPSVTSFLTLSSLSNFTAQWKAVFPYKNNISNTLTLMEEYRNQYYKLP